MMNFRRTFSCIGLLTYLLILGIHCEKVADNEDDSVLSDIRYLYQDSSNYIDPNDMLADFETIRKARSKQDENVELKSQNHVAVPENKLCSGIKDEMDTCRVQLQLLQKQLEEETTITKKLQKKITFEGQIDYQPFYKRTLSLLWKSLELEAAVWSVTEAGAAAVTRQVSLHASAAAITGLHSCLTESSEGLPPRQCDEAVSSLLRGFAVEPEQPSLGAQLLQYITTSRPSVLYSFGGMDGWLYMLAAIIAILVVWAASVLIGDVRSRRNWWPFVILIAVLVFAFCCVWTWRNMIKEEEARRAGEWEQRLSEGHGSVPPEHCRRTGLWHRLWHSLWGADPACQRFFEDTFITAGEKITPEVVIARTFTSLVLHPLRALGREMGHFFGEFYGAVPFWYLIPASMMLVVVLLIVCGYAVDFPLFMGGIRPGGRSSATAASSIDMDAITTQLRQEQQKFLQESRRMMLDISEAAVASTQRAQLVQPIIASSYRTIECQLEQLISSRLTAIVEGTVSVPKSDQPRLLQRSSSQSSLKTSGKHNQTRSHREDCLDGSSSTYSQDIPTNNRSYTTTPSVVVTGDDTNASVDEAGVRTVALCKGSGVEGADDFYKGVYNVLEESLNSSRLIELDPCSPAAGNASSARKHNTSLSLDEDEQTLSPASKKFLSKVKNALES